MASLGPPVASRSFEHTIRLELGIRNQEFPPTIPDPLAYPKNRRFLATLARSRVQDVKRGTVDASFTAFRAATRRMKCAVRELEAAVRARCRSDLNPFPARTNAAHNVMEVFLKHLDREPEVVAQIVKTPLVVAEQFDDLLTTRLCWHLPVHLEGVSLLTF